MKPKERVLATIRNEPIDRIPVCHLNFSGQAAELILGRKDVWVGGEHSQWVAMKKLWEGDDAYQEWLRRREDDVVELQKACGQDVLRIKFWPWTRKPTARVDEFTFLFGDPDGEWYTMTFDPVLELLTRRDGGSPDAALRAQGPPERDPDRDALQREVDDAERLADDTPVATEPDPALLEAIRRHPAYIIRHGHATVGADMRSATALMEMTLWPDLYARRLMAEARRIARAIIPQMHLSGLEVDMCGMDFCSRRAPCVAPATFRRVVAPALKAIVDECHRRGIYFFYGSDGNFWPVADDLFGDVGIDGWIETDKSAGMDLEALRDRYPNATFQGNIQVQIVHTGSRDDVVREVQECLDAAHKAGGVLLGVSNMIMPGTPPENILAMLETIEKGR